MSNQQNPIIQYKYGLNEIEEFEMKFKGYRSGVIVECPNKLKYELCFYDPIRLGQDLEDEEIIYEAGLVIVKEVTKQSIEKAVLQMWQNNFFDKLAPIRN